MDLHGILIANRYEVSNFIAESEMSYVYRGFDRDYHMPVAIKVLKSSEVSSRLENIVRFQILFNILSCLDHTHIARLIETGTFDIAFRKHIRYIVSELVAGINLSESMGANHFTIDESCAIIYQVCQALAAVHSLGIMHADIKPGNILVKRDSDGPFVKIIDFGMSRLKRLDEQEHVFKMSGTYGYMAPEQSGIIRKNIDERSDLYSLGVVFYELLTGVLPFNGDSIIKLLHEQAAKIPDAPSRKNGTVPGVLDAIVMKLLEKDPEHRYQSAAGLMHDLEQFKLGMLNFVPGAGDRVKRLAIEPAMVGRDTEMDRLKVIFEEMRCGRGRVCFLTGEPGIGKTRLAKEFRTYVVANGIPYMEGRAFDRENRTPHESFRDALADYLRQYHQYGLERKDTIRGRIYKTCGVLGRVVTDFHNQAEDILGECPTVVPLEKEREIQRFYMVMSRFIYGLAESEGGLVLMLDDLHWSDLGTLRFIEELARDIAGKPLLVLGAFRRGEIAADSPLQSLIRKYQDALIVEEIRLGKLDHSQVCSLIERTAVMERENIEVLTDFLMKKGGGNPLFSMQIMNQLEAERALVRLESGWLLDRYVLNAIEVPDTVVDTVMKRIKSLSRETELVLTRAAVVGKVFSVDLLVEMELLDADERWRDREARIRSIIDIIDHAMDRLILCKSNDGGVISFCHDRIRDAFYKRVPQKKLQALHRQIGVALERLSRENKEAVIFDIAYHFIEAGDEDKILEYAYPAAQKACANYSHEDAVKYLSTVRSVLEKRKDDPSAFKQWVECTKNLGEILCIIGSTDESLSLFRDLLSCVTTDQDKASIYLQMTRAYYKKGDFNSLESCVRDGLLLIGGKVPQSRFSVKSFIIKEALLYLCCIISKHVFIKKRLVNTKKYLIAIGYLDCLYWKYFLTDKNKYIWVVLRMLNIAESKIGPSRELALSMMHFGEMLTIAKTGLNKKSYDYIESAYKMFIRIGDEYGIALYFWIKNTYHFIYGEYDLIVMNYFKSFKVIEKIGDDLELIKIYYSQYLSHYYMSNYKESEYYYDLCKKHVGNIIQEIIFLNVGYPSGYYIEMGDFNKAEKDLLRAHSICSLIGIKHNLCLTCVLLGYLYSEKGETEKAFLFMDEARTIMKNNPFLSYYTDLYYPRFLGLLIQDYVDKKNLLSNRECISYNRSIRKACREAFNKTKLWPNMHFITLRQMGNYFGLINNNKNAHFYFKQSIEVCKKIGRRYELARSLYDYGLFLRQSGDWENAWDRLVSSYLIFEEIGIGVYRKRIAEQLGLSAEPAATVESAVSREKMRHMFDKTKEFGGCANISELLETVLGLAMEISGARNGHIILYDEDEVRLVKSASMTMDASASHDISWHIVNEVFESGRTVLVSDAVSEEWLSRYRSVSDQTLRSVLCFPLKYSEVVIGVCYLDNPLASGIFSEGTERILTMLFSYAVVAIEGMLMKNRQNLDKNLGKTGMLPRDKRYLIKAYSYIYNHCGEEITREMIADELGISADYLGKLFKSLAGKTLRQYVNEVRVMKARDLLNDGNQRVIDIAMDVGFDSLRTFYRCFYRFFGMTPSDYREKLARL